MSCGCIVDTNISGYNDQIEDCDTFSNSIDPADMRDADALEILSQGINILPGWESTPKPPSAAISDDSTSHPLGLRLANLGECEQLSSTTFHLILLVGQ